MHSLLSLLSAAGLSVFVLQYTASAAVVIADDFNDGVFDTSKWSGSLPFPSSNFNESGGTLNVNNRAVISTQAQIPFPITISGSFVASQFDIVNIFTRSDLQINDPYYHQLNGLFFSFPYHDQKIVIHDSNENIVAVKPFQLNAGQSYEFFLTDDGYNVSMTVNGILELSGSSSFAAGNYVGFHNRESDRGWAIPSSSSFDSFTIASSPVPEPKSTLIPTLMFASMILRRRR
jgi:hypothetical protein